MLTIQLYTEKSFLVYDTENPRGTQAFKSKLMELGGKYCAGLTWDTSGKNPDEEKRSGWVFSNKRKDDVEQWINEGCELTLAREQPPLFYKVETSRDELAELRELVIAMQKKNIEISAELKALKKKMSEDIEALQSRIYEL